MSSPDRSGARGFKEIMAEQQVEKDKMAYYQHQQKREEDLKKQRDTNKRQKLDDGTSTQNVSIKSHVQASDWDKAEQGPVPKKIIQPRADTKWDTPRKTPVVGQTPKRNRWDLTPSDPTGSGGGSTPLKTGSRFGETPTPARWGTATPFRSAMATPTPGANRFGETPTRNFDVGPGETPVGGKQGGFGSMTPRDGPMPYWHIPVDERNRPWTDEELDQLLPSVGYEVSFYAWPKQSKTCQRQR